MLLMRTSRHAAPSHGCVCSWLAQLGLSRLLGETKPVAPHQLLTSKLRMDLPTHACSIRGWCFGPSWGKQAG